MPIVFKKPEVFHALLEDLLAATRRMLLAYMRTLLRHRRIRLLFTLDDFYQETICLVYQRAPDFQGMSAKKFFACEKALARRALRDVRRAVAKEQRVLVSLGALQNGLREPETQEPSGRECLENSERQEIVEGVLDACLKELAHEDAELLESLYWLDLPLPEVAQRLGLSRNAVRKRRGRLLRCLRTRFRSHPKREEDLGP